MVLEVREACSRYFYYCVRYDIVIYFRYGFYLGVLLSVLAAGYRQSVGIST